MLDGPAATRLTIVVAQNLTDTPLPVDVANGLLGTDSPLAANTHVIRRGMNDRRDRHPGR